MATSRVTRSSRKSSDGIALGTRKAESVAKRNKGSGNLPAIDLEPAVSDAIAEPGEPAPKRIKIKYGIPQPVISHPAHIPRPKEFGSLEAYLKSFRSLENEDVSETVFDSKVNDEIQIRQRIDNAKAAGKLDKQSNGGWTPATLRKPFEPPRSLAFRDHFISQTIYFSKLAADERRNHISRARKIAAMIQVHFKRLSGADEKERKLQEKRLRQLAKRTAHEVKRKWRLAEKVVRQKFASRLQEQQRIAGQKQLDDILDHSKQLLEAQIDHSAERHMLETRDEDDNSIFDESDSDTVMDSELDTSSAESAGENDEALDPDDGYSSAIDAAPEHSDTEIQEAAVDGTTISASEELEVSNSTEILNIRAENYDASKIAKTEIETQVINGAIAQPKDEADQLINGQGDNETSSNATSVNNEELSGPDVKSGTPATPDSRPETASNFEEPLDKSEKRQLSQSKSPSDSRFKIETPFLFRGNLREYQHLGLDWLAGLYNSDTNGILADEMGLGKTIQTISLLSYLACEKQIWGPHLIVVPTSVMLNWEMEFKRFAPGFRIMTYYGNPSQRKEKRRGWNNDDSWDVCITSYQLVIHDQNAFRRKQWQYLILDEAHNIKNFRSQRWQSLLNFKTHRRLLLTGTPLQNNLIELWSLLYFLMPSSKEFSEGFASLKNFQEWFGHPVDRLIEGTYDEQEDPRGTISKLHKVLRPYLLRRLKADVEKQMPAKYEHLVYCKLSKRQRYLYDDFMSRAQTRATLASGNFLSIINCLMQLRKVCNHPDLFEVRPIVTSLALERSVVTDYEIEELLVRKRLLSERQEDKLNLDFLNLRITSGEDLSTVESYNCLRLSATGDILNEVKNLEADIGPAPDGSFSDSNDYRRTTIYRKKLSTIDTLKHRAYVNRFRCARAPIYGRNILRTSCLQPLAKWPTWDKPSLVDGAIASYDERAKRCSDLLEKFGTITPKVVVLNMPHIVFSSIPSQLFENVRQSVENPMHQAQVKLSIAFPDKRLLQYDCGKLQKLAVLLRDLQAGGHRALIFTQMTKVLDILEQFLNMYGYRYMRLDGATKIEQRQLLTERFNSDRSIFAFILSTRSGGLGINLTGADTVIFYDSDWNPSMDKQCQDRCHRIGQTQDVHIYRLVSEYTIESNILRKANQKRMLDDVVIQEGDFTTDYFSKTSIDAMLGRETTLSDDSGVQSDAGKDRKSDLEKQLALVEDDDDAAAASVALKEVNVDTVDFAEDGPPLNSRDDSRRESSAIDNSLEVDHENSTVEMDVLGKPGDEGDDDGIGSVDDYMIRFIEQGYYWTA
ncbi:SNF2 family N-terminal domain-containing protein [Dipodascopsis tothii]|uniref:SNF2 family N-terminal domain-containing protein n=1 Tax=Dipodascopsis tothii TaxID=44089 RepID=UPI0034CFB28E